GGRRSALKTLGAIDNELRPRADLLVDAADVFAENADADQLDATEEGNEHHERRVAPDDRPVHQFVEKVNRHQEERTAGDDEAEPGAEGERVGREAKDAVEPDPEGAKEAVVVGLAGKAGGSI